MEDCVEGYFLLVPELAHSYRYKVSLQHIPGAAHLPADYHSRNAMECANKECQICTFIKDSANATVFRMTVDDVLKRKVPMPFITKPAWKATQQDCPSLRRTYAHLAQGTRPNPKANNIRDVKRYLRVCTLGRDCLLVVRKEAPFAPALDLIVVPQHIVSGLILPSICACSTQLNHSSQKSSTDTFMPLMLILRFVMWLSSAAFAPHWPASPRRLKNSLHLLLFQPLELSLLVT